MTGVQTCALPISMKMENNMTAQKDGIVTVAVSKGASVGSGDTLFTIA